MNDIIERSLEQNERFALIGLDNNEMFVERDNNPPRSISDREDRVREKRFFSFNFRSVSLERASIRLKIFPGVIPTSD